MPFLIQVVVFLPDLCLKNDGRLVLLHHLFAVEVQEVEVTDPLAVLGLFDGLFEVDVMLLVLNDDEVASLSLRAVQAFVVIYLIWK